MPLTVHGRQKLFVLPETAADQIRKLLESSLSGLKEVFSPPPAVRKTRRSRKRKASSKDVEETAEPSAKRVCTIKDPSSRTEPVLKETPSLQEHKTSLIDSSLNLMDSPLNTEEKIDSSPEHEKEKNASTVSDQAKAKKLELVVGVNAVTRQLEQGRLKVGLVCSTSPGMLYQHILPLAATREVPFAALPDLSKSLARLLGIKRAMCVGWKKVSNSSNQFDDLTSTIARLTPPVSLPWLATKAEEERLEEVSENKERMSLGASPLLTGHVAMAKQEKGGLKVGVVSSLTPQAVSTLSPLLTEHVAMGTKQNGGGKVGVVYTPLAVKKTKVVPNSKRRRRGKRRKPANQS